MHTALVLLTLLAQGPGTPIHVPGIGDIAPTVLMPVVEGEEGTGEEGALISFENGLLDDDGTTSQIDLPFMLYCTFSPLSELTKVKTEIAEKSEGRLVLQVIHGVPCVLPTGKGRTKRMLQRPITLHLKNVSTWEAIKALVNAVNAPADDLWPMHISVATRSLTMPPPEPFTQEKIQNVDLQNVFALEALCAITARSPIPMRFEYYNSCRPELHEGHSVHPRSRLVIDFTRDVRELSMKTRYAPRPTAEQERFWSKELESIKIPVGKVIVAPEASAAEQP